MFRQLNRYAARRLEGCIPFADLSIRDAKHAPPERGEQSIFLRIQVFARGVRSSVDFQCPFFETQGEVHFVICRRARPFLRARQDHILELPIFRKHLAHHLFARSYVTVATAKFRLMTRRLVHSTQFRSCFRSTRHPFVPTGATEKFRCRFLSDCLSLFRGLFCPHRFATATPTAIPLPLVG